MISYNLTSDTNRFEDEFECYRDKGYFNIRVGDGSTYFRLELNKDGLSELIKVLQYLKDEMARSNNGTTKKSDR